MPGMWRLNGHLGSAVSALVDGQLDPHEAERAWAHVMTCPPCRRLVEREGWVKRQLAEIAGTEPALLPPGLLGSLHGLRPAAHEHDAHAARAAWAAVHALEDRSRSRRRVGIAAAGVGSVSAAVLGLSSLSGATLDIGGVPNTPASSETRPAPSAPTPDPAPTPAPSPFSGWLGGESSEQGTRTVPVRLIG